MNQLQDHQQFIVDLTEVTPILAKEIQVVLEEQVEVQHNQTRILIEDLHMEILIRQEAVLLQEVQDPVLPQEVGVQEARDLALLREAEVLEVRLQQGALQDQVDLEVQDQVVLQEAVVLEVLLHQEALHPLLEVLLQEEAQAEVLHLQAEEEVVVHVAEINNTI